jgi:protease I
MNRIPSARVAILIEDNYEDLELQYPRLRLREEGVSVVVVGPGRGQYKGKHGYPQKEDATYDALVATSFDGVVIPGGWAPDRLRRSKQVLQFVRDMDAAGKLVATICHGPWVVASAGIVRGREMTSVEAIRDDLVNAGARWVDRETVVDRNLVTARVPDDLPAFMRACVELLSANARA